MFVKMLKKSLMSVTVGAVLLSGATPALAKTNDTTVTGNGQEVKNVIVMIADGWGVNQIAATNYYQTGKEQAQVYENFPTKAFMSTYSYGSDSKADDAQAVYDPASFYSDFNLFDPNGLMMANPTDSAAAGTAMSTGTKTYDAAIGVDQDYTNLTSITQDFEDLGRATGVVSSVQFSHATPASYVAHNGQRNNYAEIANEMINDSKTDVIMGAGNPDFDDNGVAKSADAQKQYKYVGGQATWEGLKAGTIGNDANGDGQVDNWNLIQTKEEFEALTTGETPDRVVGVAQAASTLQQGRGGNNQADAFVEPMNQNVPDLATMTSGALNVLDNEEEGFFLMVEGGAVDWAGHANQSGRVIEEMADFNKAVEAVDAWVQENSNWGETLLIVTGDHETGYLTGTPGVYDKVVNNGQGVMPTMAWNSGNHTNQLIPFYAKGQGAAAFKKLADEEDTLRGKYLDNTELVVAIRELLK